MSSIGSGSSTAITNPGTAQADIVNAGEDRHVDSDEEDASSTDTYGQRPGRFYGPDSSWRFYTRNERGLAASLDQAVCNDLSLQLYNVHAFKASLRNADASNVKRWQSKQRWVLAKDTKRRGPFQPRPKFSAWPLKPSSVPRASEIWGAVPVEDEHKDATVLARNPEPWKPSLDLQEELKAVFLRQAKEQLYEHRRRSVPRRTASERYRDSRDSLVATSPKVHLPDDDAESSTNGDSRSDSRGSTFYHSSPEQTPEFMDDDEAAGAILQPTVRHLISKQDELLNALHLSRLGQHHDPSATWKKQRSSRNNSRASTLASNLQQASDTHRRDASDVKPQYHDGQRSSETETKPSVKQGRKRKRKLGQRDWSEVLGMAAMMGWDKAVVDRAARRCAALFDEGMSMRFMTGDMSAIVEEKVVEYVPDMVPAIDDLTAPNHKLPVVDLDAFFCPYSSCDRHEQPYTKRWRLTEHLRRKHNHACQKFEADDGDNTSKARHSTIDLSSRSSSSSEAGEEVDEGEADDE